MRVLIVVCIYDRFENLKKWVHSWNLCDKMGAKLVVVHNVDKFKSNPFANYCKANGIMYIRRQNIGYETGIIQDVFLNRLRVRYDWDALLFCTDDTIPMRKNYLSYYINEISKPDVGAACMEVSGVWTPHIRTTGFCVTREVANKIHWIHDPVSTKEHCYFFEHQGFEDTIMSQILKMDKRVIQLSSIKESVLWDTDHTALDRMDEWRKEFNLMSE
jgi:hypothetical protein